jgi:tetratricopeptide (TPR) repeat protein
MSSDGMSDGKRDFFVSFNQADRAWATWIAWVLEENGYSVFFQDWDFKGNFVLEMDKAHTQSRRTLAVLSPDYITSRFTAPEWAARFAEDATSEHNLLIPIRVRPCELQGLLAQITYADLVGVTRDEARQRLLNRVAGIRLKPKEEPFFPGGPLPAATRSIPSEPRFPMATHNLPPFNPDFVGREPVLAELRRRLTSGRGPAVLSQAISGLGGVGKTQTALAYCYRYLADYTLVWWLRAGTPAALAADVAKLAAPLDLDPAAADQEKLIDSVRAALQTREGWLLVFDNVEEPELPRAFLPTTGQGHALITSRRTDWQSVAKVLELEVMKEGEALQLLTGRPDPDTLPEAERAAAEALAKELGYLPLALAQARAYMAETGKSLAGYRRLFEVSRPAVLERGRASRDPTSVAKTWQISIEAAEGICAAARPLLELLAFFSADPLPVVVLAAKPEALPEGLHEELARGEAIGALKRFSLIQAEKDALTVHRLVQAATRDGLDTATAKTHAKAAVQLVNAALPGPSWEHTNWPAIGALLPHALATAEAAELLEAGLETAATVLDHIALYHSARAAYADAEPLYKRAIAIDEKVLGPEHPDVAPSLNNLALLYRDTGRYPEAEPLYNRVLSIWEKALGPEHPNIATVANNLAELYQATGRYPEAEPLFQRSLSIREKVLGPEHPDVAPSLNNLAALYQATGRYPEAEPLYKRVLSILEKALGPEHPNIATVANNLAELYRDTGRYPEAEPLYKRAIAIDPKALPPGHPHRMRLRENYANLLDRLGRHAEAAELRGQTQASR